ncbi:hypothetical protein N7G274_009881 [Stereocaulon virgatum]|uniref:WD40 repeat-like protein n=1 Tax=Stereocaulon virgatum TaxID=373712 RepID=A0ABR3ZXF3_9LECA
MKLTLQDRLLRRELGNTSRYSTVKGIYGDRVWIDDLDIVNELGGHSGCVNALSWSTSGSLLASGSDDQHLNIHSYQPDSSVSPFTLTTTVATGHTANIFSVKFMPHSNDRTLVTAAGDCEVRVFDIEYSGRTAETPMGPNIATTGRGQRFQNMYRGVRYLSDGNTNARVYRSHADRVKRIVTESSPNLFLTCSEDGEVRQFDLRLPSYAYPPPRGGRGFLAHRADHDNSNVPPPLISYKRYNLDLNTISCSASQPHYIVLGGAHLHCFLHDRRMLGRNVDEEHGNPGRASPVHSMSSYENEMMGQATRCVRKYAPEGRKKMRRTENGHITACKISDANPNEMIASWSGDHVYSFDLVRSPDAKAQDLMSESVSISGRGKGKVRESGDRKRKRKKDNSTTSMEAATRSSKPRHAKGRPEEEGDLALRVRYENGQTEDIAMSNSVPHLPLSMVEDTRESILNESQRRSLQIAKSLVKIRRLMFSLEATIPNPGDILSSDPSHHTASFTATLGTAATCIPEMDEITRVWRYPVDPVTEDIVFQQTLRGNRNSSRRFVQAAGTLARMLGGKIQTASRMPSPALDLFREITPSPDEGSQLPKGEIFCYDFLRAIILWLEGGPQALLQGFKRPPSQRLDSPRFPVPDDAQLSAIDECIIPYLLRLARAKAIPNVDASRFLTDKLRQIFESESAAVIAFGSAVKMPLEDTTRALEAVPQNTDNEARPYTQDRKTATKYWGFKVGRGLLMNAGKGINFQFVDIAFGGLGTSQVDEGRVQEEVDPNEDEGIAEDVSLVKQRNSTIEGSTTDEARSPSAQLDGSDVDVENAGSDAEVILMDDLHNEIADHMAAEDEDEDNDYDNANDDADSDADDDDDGEITAEERQFMFQSASDRGKLREKVEKDVPCDSHTRKYTGHCNVKTVKDANFFGLQDEYVVSGSDGGHLFIWDKKTTELVNILEGDNEVVNVVQGPPSEPLLAVSGIDHTIKIFSPDSRAQKDAEEGINISSATNSSSGYSSLSGRRRQRRDSPPPTAEEGPQREGLTSRKRMQNSYQIISQNDVQRQGGMRDAFITRGMLAQLAARLRARQGGADGPGGGVILGEDGEAVIVDDNCTVM